ncbi:VPLPA-CTERM sorting domain-containing protein [Cypionkella sp. TWP1-2-1b2]|uniref:VPLPA-CTERM sorting domain-containing protein n=1 Tax=Cypionkella sp. TWP1-2-1b2 TaxID=2804675 RepID=UPI003CED6A24
MIFKYGLAAALLVGTVALPASAATITFTGANGGDSIGYTEAGLMFDDARIQSGNCNASASGAPCMALNKKEISKLTSETLGALFTVTSFWFKLLGASPAELTVKSSKGGNLVLTEAVYGNNNDGKTYNLVGNALFADIEWITFTNSGKGNSRVDDIGTPAAVPLPAAGWLMVAGLVGLTALRRKRKAI